MARQVDEDVDVVREDHAFELVVRQSARVAPDVGELAELRRRGVALGVREVAVQLHLGAVVRLEHGLHEEADDVPAEVRRDIADAQPARRIAIPAERSARARLRRRELLAEPTMLGVQRFRCDVLQVVEPEQQIAPGHARIRRERDDPAQRGDALRELALRLQRVGEAQQRGRVVRVVGECRPRFLFRGRRLAVAVVDVRQVHVRNPEIRIELERTLQLVDGMRRLFQPDQRDAQIEMGAGHLRTERHEREQDLRGFAMPAALDEDVRQVEQRRGVSAGERVRLPVEHLCLVGRAVRLEHVGQQVQGVRVVGGERHGVVELDLGLRQVTRRLQGRAEFHEVECAGGRDRDRLPMDFDRFVELPRDAQGCGQLGPDEAARFRALRDLAQQAGGTGRVTTHQHQERRSGPGAHLAPVGGQQLAAAHFEVTVRVGREEVRQEPE